MREISIEESKQIQIRILESIDFFCRKNNIKYSLSGGSMIGAIRHKGFIPWDDDIDIMMQRKDYDKFLATYSDNYYQLLSFKKIKSWPFLYSSVVDPETVLFYGDRRNDDRGIWVSIFPVEYIDVKKIPKQVKRLKFYENYVYRMKNSFWTPNTRVLYNVAKAIGRFVLLPFPNSWWLKRLEKITVNKTVTDCLGSPCVWGFAKVFYYSDVVFSKYIDVDFENRKFMAVAGFDEYLRSEFGDYMQLPPEEERVPKHGFKAYWK